MIDIGANLTHDSFDADREEVISAAQAVGVSTFIITGSSEKCSQQARDLAHTFADCCFATAGVHPHHAAEVDGDVLDVIEHLLSDEKVIAVGETGLDYFRDFSPRPAQQFSFEQHIKLAMDTQLPMFLHQRDAHVDFLPMLKEHRDQLSDVVVHCFTDERQALFDYLDLDCHIGITGWVCDERRGKHLLELVPNIPRHRLMIETDSPYLLPRNLKPKPKSRRNEPKYLPHIAAFIADLYGISVEQLTTETTEASRAFFNI
ncbi:TatD family hydrolase [Marinicella sp. W31]|uniref:TatD family hydrolase n=1 Tax=Marinicella sp. W31 TaxID=3023713 RepID=UPI003757B5C2